MPYETGQIRGTLTPSSQNISFNRETAILPTLSNVIVRRTIGIVEMVTWYIQFENTAVEWLDSLGSTDGYLDWEGTQGTLPLSVKNLDQLTGSNYKATIFITMSNSDDPFYTLTETINLSLSGTAANAIRTDKTNYNLVYRRSNNTLSGDTLVNIVNNTSSNTFNFETIGTLLKESSSTTGFTLMEDPVFPFATNSELPSSGTVVVSCRLKKDGVIVYPFTVTIAVINTEDIITAPSEINFTLRKGFNESLQDYIDVVNPLNKSFTVVKPWWLTTSISSGNTSIAIGMTTVNSEEIDPGRYSGLIELHYDTNKIMSVPIYLEVLEFVTVEPNDYNFCLDGIVLKSTKMFETGIFAKVIMKMQFTTDEGLAEFDSSYLIPYFNSSAETDIGKKVQNYFPVFDKHLFEASEMKFNNKLVYGRANVLLSVQELDVSYTVLHTTTLNPVKMFAGKRPAKFPLFSNYGIRRKYSGISHIFSYYTGVISPENLIVQDVPSNPAGENDVQTVLITDETILNLDSIKENLGLEFLPMPDEQRQISVQWLNNNLVPEIMIFSGSYTIQDELEHSVDSYQINGKKYNTKEIGKITVRTGFILKEEILLLKEIANSLISFMKIGDDIYDCVCTTSKLIREDSEENLIQREMEFFIVL